MVKIKLNMEASSIENSSFNTLPTKLQTFIFQFLNGEDLKSARLVCPHWFRVLGLIRPLGFKLENNNSENLQMLKKSFHPVIEVLLVSNYTEILPIYTSKRFKLPKAKYVILDSGNSVENVMKLLRNYAKLCYGLGLAPNSFEKVAPFRLKGLTFEPLRYFCFSFDLQDDDFGNRNHLIALTQFLKTAKLPNLLEFHVECPPWMSKTNIIVLEYHQAINMFFEKHGKQLTVLGYEHIYPEVVINSFKHLSTLETFNVEFNGELSQPEEIDGIREAIKHIKQLKSLKCSDFGIGGYPLVLQLHSEFILSMLKENRKFIKKFCYESWFPRTDWIPAVDSQVEFVGLEEIQLRFVLFNGNAFNARVNQELRSVTKLNLTINLGATQDWMTQISPWMFGTFPNLNNLTFDCETAFLNLLDFRSLIRNLVHLKKLLIKCLMTNETRSWFTNNNHDQFIKSVSFFGGFEILLSRPFPNDIFD